MRKNPINAFYIFAPDLKKKDLNHKNDIYFFTLSSRAANNNEVFLQVDAKGEKSAAEKIPGYLLQYNSNVNHKSQIPKLIIPKKNPQANFVFTPAFTGCSLIVEETSTHYVVYHDPRPYKFNDEYVNVVAVLHQDHMQIEDSVTHASTALGFALMYYDEKQSQWIVIGQRLKFATLDKEKGIQHFALNKSKDSPLIINLIKKNYIEPPQC